MQDRTASKTALATAYIRAAHQLLDKKPLLFDNPVALPLLGPQAADIIHSRVAHHQSPEGKSLRTHVVLRSRFAEDRLKAAAERGVTRYVIIGVGNIAVSQRRSDIFDISISPSSLLGSWEFKPDWKLRHQDLREGSPFPVYNDYTMPLSFRTRKPHEHPMRWRRQNICALA